MIIAGCDASEVSEAIGVPEKKYKDFINKDKRAREFVLQCENLQEDKLLADLANSDRWAAKRFLLAATNPKKYSDTGIRLKAEKPDDSNENEFLKTTIRLRDSIIEKHYRHFEAGYDWTLSEGGSRSGKTFNFLKWAYLQTRQYKFDLSLIAPSYKMLERGVFDDIKTILADFAPDIHIPERPTKIELHNGSVWNFEVVTNENEAKRNRVNVFINECDGVPEIVANLIGRASGRKFGDFNPVKKFWAHKKIDEAGNNLLISTWKDNPYLTSNQLQWFADLKKYGENAEEGSPERYAYEVYYLGQYSLLSGKAYEMEDFDIVEEVPEAFDYYISYSDPSLGVGEDFFATLLLGIKGKQVYATDCIFSQFTKVGGFIEKLKEWDAKYNNKVDHYAEKNGTSGVVTKAARQLYEGTLSEVANSTKKEADIIVYSTTAKKFKFLRSGKMIEFLKQCADFPNDAHDDAPDCLGRATKIILKNFDI